MRKYLKNNTTEIITLTMNSSTRDLRHFAKNKRHSQRVEKDVKRDINSCKHRIFHGEMLHEIQSQKSVANSVAVIIPIYNKEEYIRETIESVLSQSFNNLELILVDDMGADSSIDIAFEYLVQDERVKYFCNGSNRGLYRSRQNGTSVAVSEYFCNLDADDIHASNALQTLMQEARSFDADIVQMAMWRFGGEKYTVQQNSILELPDGAAFGLDIVSLFLQRKINFSVCNKLIRRSVWLKAREFLPKNDHISILEDLPQMATYALFADSYATTTEPLYGYRQVDSSMSLDEATETKHSILAIKFVDFIKNLYLEKGIIKKLAYDWGCFERRVLNQYVTNYALRYLDGKKRDLARDILKLADERGFSYACFGFVTKARFLFDFQERFDPKPRMPHRDIFHVRSFQRYVDIRRLTDDIRSLNQQDRNLDVLINVWENGDTFTPNEYKFLMRNEQRNFTRNKNRIAFHREIFASKKTMVSLTADVKFASKLFDISSENGAELVIVSQNPALKGTYEIKDIKQSLGFLSSCLDPVHTTYVADQSLMRKVVRMVPNLDYYMFSPCIIFLLASFAKKIVVTSPPNTSNAARVEMTPVLVQHMYESFHFMRYILAANFTATHPAAISAMRKGYSAFHNSYFRKIEQSPSILADQITEIASSFDMPMEHKVMELRKHITSQEMEFTYANPEL